MYLIVGLGNPEEEYSKTRHNMGFNAINKIAEQYGIKVTKNKFQGLYESALIEGEKVILLKPQTYMNLSGNSVKEFVDFYKISKEEILVIYDDMDIEPGKIKIRKKGSAGGHNGMKSIVSMLGTEEFTRIRIGIGRPEHNGDDINYVIGSIPEEEIPKLEEGVEKAKKAVIEILKNGVDSAMNKLNYKGKDMIELIVNKSNDTKIIAAVENGKLVEIYEENEQSQKARNEGNIYIGIVKDIVPGMQAAFVDIGTEKNSFIHVKDVVPQVDEKIEKRIDKKIKDVVKSGEKILIQIQKDSNEKKGARTSTHIKLTGKYVILMPNTNIVTISQKIENDKERERLLEIVKKVLPENTGAIVRTAALKKNGEEIEKDLNQLVEKWKKIKAKFDKAPNKPQLLFKSPSFLEKLILDLPENKIEKIEVNEQKEYEKIRKMLNDINEKISLELSENIFEKYELEKQIEKTKQRKIWLNCGGFITIDQTEALVAIDVNSGKFTGKNTLEETVYKVNYEATIEIAKQLRLRDIGGIIIIDYIDMQKQENKEKIEKLLKESLKQDRAKTQVEGFTKLNLMELTRKHICSHNS